MERNNGIDLFRLIGAFFIMILHTSLGTLNTEFVENLRLLARWSVPFYFMASGYFIGLKIVSGQLIFNKIERNISALISLSVITFIIYAPISPSDYGIENLLLGIHYHLWFIGSLLFGYIFIWYIYYIKMSVILPFVSFLLLFCLVISDSYDVVFRFEFGNVLFRFLSSIPFLYLGISISKNTLRLRHKKLLFFIVIFGFILQFLEASILKLFFNVNMFNIECTVGTIIVAISLFIFLSYINIKESLLTKMGQKYSLFIYLYHPILYFLMSFFCKKMQFGNSLFMFFPIIGFPIMLCSGILFSKYFSNIFKILNGNFTLNFIKNPSKLDCKI